MQIVSTVRAVLRAPLLAALVAGVCTGQVSLKGIVDIHVHSSSDVRFRSAAPLEMARMARAEGVRCLVFKDSTHPTYELADEISRAVPEMRTFGSIVLNGVVGGINPEAVEHMAMCNGGAGRIVYMPTSDAENEVTLRRQNRPFVAVSRDCVLLPEVLDVLKVIAKHNLVLATSHLTADEVLELIREARRAGVKQIVVTHGMAWPIRMTIAQMQEAAGMEAYIEFAYNLAYPNPAKGGKSDSGLDVADYARAIQAIGAVRCIISTDVGMAWRPVPAEAMKEYIAALLKAGITGREIDLMARRNPARLLGLE